MPTLTNNDSTEKSYGCDNAGASYVPKPRRFPQSREYPIYVKTHIFICKLLVVLESKINAQGNETRKNDFQYQINSLFSISPPPMRSQLNATLGKTTPISLLYSGKWEIVGKLYNFSSASQLFLNNFIIYCHIQHTREI